MSSKTAKQEIIDAMKRMMDVGKHEIHITDVYVEVPLSIDWDLTMETLLQMQEEGMLTIGDDDVVTLNEHKEGQG